MSLKVIIIHCQVIVLSLSLSLSLIDIVPHCNCHSSWHCNVWIIVTSLYGMVTHWHVIVIGHCHSWSLSLSWSWSSWHMVIDTNCHGHHDSSWLSLSLIWWTPGGHMAGLKPRPCGHARPHSDKKMYKKIIPAQIFKFKNIPPSKDRVRWTAWQHLLWQYICIAPTCCSHDAYIADYYSIGGELISEVQSRRSELYATKYDWILRHGSGFCKQKNAYCSRRRLLIYSFYMWQPFHHLVFLLLFIGPWATMSDQD